MQYKNTLKLQAPVTSDEFVEYYNLRWRVLREPWNMPPGTERDEIEESSIHRMLVDKPIGVVAVGRLHYNSSSQGQIRFMAVHPNCHGRGYGSIILSELEKIALQGGREEIILQARDNAVHFYQKNGYSIREKSYVLFESIQHYLMYKMLD
ncbi:MAG: GNAT family N-acetyltransferase [Fidelibacterota bacterium]